MIRILTTGLFLALCQAATGGAVAAQESGLGEDGRISPADSARVNRSSRSEQADFERLRRNRLPETWPRSGGQCDEWIGRFCLTHDDGFDDWVAPPEDPDVVAARRSLIAHLTEASMRIPGDGWIAGQRVRYLVEARRFDAAVAAAEDCRAETSWCAAVEGFALHYAGRPAAADSAFSLALATMPEAERARWNDLGFILEGQISRVYRRLDSPGRAAFEERFWTLSDPLFSRPGNELRSEHLARQVMDQFQDRAQSPDGISWGEDLREILVRYGWPSGWERVRTQGFRSSSDASFISHYSSAPQRLLPPAAALLGDSTSSGDWDVELRRARTGYNVPMADSVARWFFPLEHQTAAFRRGADALVAAAFELPADSVPETVRTLAGLALLPSSDPLPTPRVTVMETTGRRGTITTSAPAGALLVSLEILVPEERRISRARRQVSIAPLEAGAMAISDLLLIAPDSPLPDSLTAALDRARTSPRVAAGEEIGIFWEMYGLSQVENPVVTMSLRLLDDDAGWLRRLAERAGILREVMPIRLRWQEPVTPGDIFARSLALRVPDVSTGRYILELVAELPGAEPLTAHRAIEVIDPYRR